MPDPLLDLPPRLRATPLGRPGGVAWVRRAVTALAVLAVAGLLATGGSSPKDPTLAASRVPGFGEATLRVLVAAPTTGVAPTDRCTLLAATDEQHSRGLMGRRDLAGYAAMSFLWDRDVDYLFYNRDVPMAISVAFFGADGGWITTKDLEPCPDVEGCPTIASPSSYRYVVELEKGGMGRLGIGPGARIAVSPGCT